MILKDNFMCTIVIKRILWMIIIPILICPCLAKSQYPPLRNYIIKTNVIDSGNIKVLYALNATNILQEETYDDLLCLEIGEFHSKYFSYFLWMSDSVVLTLKHPQGGRMRGPTYGKKGGEWVESRYSEYFKDFTKNTITGYIEMPWGLQNYNSRTTEDTPVQNWQLHNDTLTVAGYICQKATCYFRGRSYTAWFTADIPINNGPWKFGGLPGLILKIYDNDNLYNFECVGIQNYFRKFPIRIRNSYENNKEMNREKLMEFLKKLHYDYRGMAGIVSVDYYGNPAPNIRQTISPYHPLELE
jgi:GLPGLI family protein